MIRINKSETADTRTCDFSKVTKETLLASSKQHIRDVREAHQFFSRLIAQAMIDHDTDKLTDNRRLPSRFRHRIQADGMVEEP